MEPGEIYFEDFYVTSKDWKKESSNKNNIDENQQCLGHLKMCSKSLVFVPKDKLLPLLKIPYKDCDKITEWEGTLLQSNDNNCILIEAKQYIEMLDKNILAPYVFKLEKKIFLFKLHYAQISEYLPQICQLHRASSLHAYEQNSMVNKFNMKMMSNTKKLDKLIFFLFKLILDSNNSLFSSQSTKI